MKPEVKTKLIEALRSGNYKQGRGALCSENGAAHCVLGVLCDLHAQETGAGWTPVPGSDECEYMDCTNMPPIEVRMWADIHGVKRNFPPKTKPQPYYSPANHYTVTTGLIKMNDDGASFATIATWIEENL